MGTPPLTTEQRRLLTGALIISAVFTALPASFNYFLNPMLEGLNASHGQTSVLRQLPSVSMLLVVFLSGTFGDRMGDRRALTTSSSLFTVGAALVAMAPVLPVATAGLVFQNVGIASGSVVGIGMVSSHIREQSGRATAFAAFAIVTPLVYLNAPLIAGLVVDQWTWRAVPGLLFIGGLVCVWASRRLLPADGPPRGAGEYATPLVAGVLLVALVQLINIVADQGFTSSATAVHVAIVLVGMAVLSVLYRHLPAPSLSLAALRSGGTPVLLTVVVLVPFANLLYYGTMGFQYVFGLSTLQTALAMAPSQLGGVAGATIAKTLLQRRGVLGAGTVMLTLLGFGMLPLLAIQVDSPLWVPIAAFTLYGASLTGAGVPITNAIMNTATRGNEGSAAAFRSAAGYLGAALGVLFTTTVITMGIAASMKEHISEQGLQSSPHDAIVSEIFDRSTSESIASQYSVPVETVQTLKIDLAESMVDGLHSAAIAGTVVAMLCIVMYRWGLQRQGRRDASAPA